MESGKSVGKNLSSGEKRERWLPQICLGTCLLWLVVSLLKVNLQTPLILGVCSFERCKVRQYSSPFQFLMDIFCRKVCLMCTDGRVN